MKKAFGVIRRILSGLLTLLAVALMVFTLITVLGRSGDKSIFGVQMMVVMSDSMKATDFAAGDMIFVKQVDTGSLQEGDVICYRSVDPDSYGRTITHKIRSITADKYGELSFVTYGTTTNVDDELPVSHRDVQGKYIGRIPKLGLLIQFLKTNPMALVYILAGVILMACITMFVQARFEKGKYSREDDTKEQAVLSDANIQGGVNIQDEVEEH